MEDVNRLGSIMVACAVLKHPLASVIVTVYVPGHNPVAVCVVCEPALASHM